MSDAPANIRSMTNQTSTPTLNAEQRETILNQRIAQYTRKGWQVQSVTTGQAILTKNRRIGWFWNTVLVVITAGLWLIYVIYKALNRKNDTVVINVDAYGKVKTR